MSQPLPHAWSPAEILEWESRQPDRYEYIGGMVRMMVGASIAHNLIVGALRDSLRRQLRGTGCRVLSESVKLVRQNGDFAYPDVMVSCGGAAVTDDRVTDAVLIAEILSRSAADYDRGAKWETYRDLPALRTYLLIAQDRRQVEVFRRDGSSWRFDILTTCAVEVLDGITINLEDVYEDLPDLL